LASPVETTASPLATPTPTLTPAATPTATVDVASRRVLLLQSDGGVAVYRDTAAALLRALPARMELADLRGDRAQGAEVARGAAGRSDLIVAVGSLAASAARAEAPGAPLLFCAVLNPQRYPLSGPNVAGVSFEVPAGEQLERLKLALPGAVRVGVIYDPAKSQALVNEAERAAARLRLDLVKAVAREPREVDFVFRTLRKDIDVLWMIPDSTVITPETFQILALQAAESNVPFLAFGESFARQGALLAFYPDPTAVGGQCAALAAAILRGEARPGEIGLRAPDSVRVAVNRQVESQLAIKLSPALRADVEIR
jgi:putative ABC transport system substrate-binding protein